MFFFTGTASALTVSTFDVLVATETLTVVGTTTLSGNAFSVGASTLVINNGNVGIGTTTPSGLLHVVELGLGQSSHLGELLWSKGVFRTGFRDPASTEWDPVNSGVWSFSSGLEQQAGATTSALVGGSVNLTVFGSPDTFIGGGTSNTAEGGITAGQGGAIVGGSDNVAQANWAFIGGGVMNSVQGIESAVLGGLGNQALGDYSATVGGTGNIASGKYSFAAGSFADASAQGSFVWADSQAKGYVSVSTDEFKARARGGFVFYSSTATPTVIVSSGSIMISTSATAAGAVPNIYISSANGYVGMGTSNPSSPLQVSGTAAFSATGASTYSIISSSGINVLNGPVNLGANSQINWPDGTISTSANSGKGGGSVVFASTQSMNFLSGDLSISYTSASIGISTLTITASGSWHICTGGTVQIINGTAATVNGISLEINGSFPASFGSQQSPWLTVEQVVNNAMQISLQWRSPAVQGAGSVSATLAPWAPTGTMFIRGGNTSTARYAANWWFTECP